CATWPIVVATTMGQVAQLTVPRLADLCVIDLLDEDGSIRDVAVSCSEPRLATELERLRTEYPLDPDGPHPVAKVLRSGEPVLLEQLDRAQLTSFAQGSVHARFMIEHGYRSAIVAPLLARGRTLGAVSVLRLGEVRGYARHDLTLTCELARRAALAIDNARLFSDLQRAERRLQAVLVNLAEAITVVDRAGNTVFANQAAADLLKVREPADLIDASPGAIMPRFAVYDEHGNELALDAMPGRRLFAGETAEPLLVRNIVRATGEERWIVVRSSPVLDPDSGELLYVVNVLENITEVKRVQLAESFMSEASRVLASSLDYNETLRRVARLAVPTIADWCAVDVLDERGQIVRVATHHSDPSMVALAERLNRDYQAAPDEPTGVPEVIRTGEARIHTDVRPDELAEYARDSEHLRLLSAVRATAVIIVPMIGADRITGAITLVSSEGSRRLSPEDLPLAERLARRSGTAVENARLYTERSRIADTLQRALLPASLPPLHGAQVRARYRAAGELNEVGGDFYDLFRYGKDAWMLLIGDVCGKGPHAAATTALARHTLRAGAMSGLSPSGMLEMLHRALREQPDGSDLCTVCLVRFEPDGDRGKLGVTLGGHPAPLLIDRDGHARPIGEAGTLLGALDPVTFHESEGELGHGETLLMYTDGVTEARRDGVQLGEDGLIELCRAAPSLTLEALLERLERAAVEHAGGHMRDDLALLGLRLDHTSPARRR
ncbi:MAG TPA: SpoIIE family protein phosphatase, partial [Solirubrobacteraceae bacterium]|nr:SpoIIE family protein phosphatase [Solirubrobacteraceae bacterium]